MNESSYYLGFSVFEGGVGPTKFNLLLNHFKSAENAWKANTLELSSVIGQVTTAKFDSFRQVFSIEDYQTRLSTARVLYIATCDEEYPPLLKEIKNPPIGIFVKGDSSVLHQTNTFAVVGTRKTTSYGINITEMFTRELVAGSCTIISGLAFGVDTIAHRTTLDCNGKTAAVLGCGVDCCTPPSNQDLYNSIVEKGGVIVSEVPLGHPPLVGTFPSRNRIIAGLSVGTLVTEGAEDSGALITADYAMLFGRPVFAIPGPINSPMSKGPYKVIEKGAKLVTAPKDILDYLHVQNNSNGQQERKIIFADNNEKLLGELLLGEPMTYDQLVRKSGLESALVGSVLSMMELKGMIKAEANGSYAIKF